MSTNISIGPAQRITVGHGEYIIYHEGFNPPSKAVYNATYAILNQFNTPATPDRYALIQEKIKAIDPSLRATFIPRTLYDLQFIKQSIKEDVKRGGFCKHEMHIPDPYHPTDNCWHIAYFDHEENDHAPAIKILSYNLNQNLLKKLKKHAAELENSSLTFQTISQLLNKQIHFFRNLGKREFQGKPTGDGALIDKFGDPNIMKIRNDEDAQTISRTVALECHAIAEKAFLLFRGSVYSTDLPFSPNNDQQPYSFSFGSSLFSGAVHSTRTTAYFYTKNDSEGYVIALPAEELNQSPFVIPKKNPLCQLNSNYDDIYHPRTKIWKTNEHVWGFDESAGKKGIMARYSCNLDRQALTDAVLEYKHRNVIFLKSPRHPIMTVPLAFLPTIHVLFRAPSNKTLYLRGNNQGGLNWNQGQPLIQIGEEEWIYRIPTPVNDLDYKILIGDNEWEEGGNHQLALSKDTVDAPHFNVETTPIRGKTSRLHIECEVGFGNNLFIYGNGPGMSWLHGQQLSFVGNNSWIWETTEDFNECDYKLVINNTKWETGPNRRLEYGKQKEIFPRF